MSDISVTNPDPVIVIIPPAETTTTVIDQQDPITAVVPEVESIVKITPGGGGGASSMTQLTDVDLVSAPPAVGSVLVYEADGVWRPSMTEDYRNFRGDWQNPAGTLLWSTDFSDVNDTSMFETIAGGSVSAGPTLSIDHLAPLPAGSFGAIKTTCSRASALGSSNDLFFLGLHTANTPKPVGSVPTKLKATCKSLNGATAGSVFYGGPNWNPLVVLKSSSAALIDWESYTVDIPEGVELVSVSRNRGTSSSTTQTIWMTLIELYGVPSSDDIYQINDVVSHQGTFYRSLYNHNIDTPGSSSKWLAIPPLTP